MKHLLELPKAETNLTLWKADLTQEGSFVFPTDTFLPGMYMEKSMKLTSWKTQNDPWIRSFVFQKDQVTSGKLSDSVPITRLSIHFDCKSPQEYENLGLELSKVP
ncbi:hypothetical protein L2E82_46116 [Cichorium intybus]|uniref:Uncharacterized protein n=1 Tax=Cichorium intybus TaxID=13427 RepID=A0ACB8YTP7_CICIN|nr:hypothetical protein L2E82_46116 [Cichorium intybus]